MQQFHRSTQMIVAGIVLFFSLARTFAAPVDRIMFGNEHSEKDHLVQAQHSDIISGALGHPARRLLPLEPPTWQGGSTSFKLKIDPEKPNYFTARFWGSESNPNRLILFCNGKQIGYRHLGDVDILDFGSEDNGGGYPGRFYYNTSPLPLAMTKGKTELTFEIRSTGRTWGYASTFEQYQKPMSEPTRGIYAVYTHTETCFVPPADEKQGATPLDPPVRQTPGPEILDQVKKRVNDTLNEMLSSTKPLNQVQVHLLANAYHVKWTTAYRNPKAVEQIVTACDALFVAYRENPRLPQNDPAVYNGDWFGLGMMGDAIRLLAEPLSPFLDHPVNGAADVTRRSAWSQMLCDSRDWHRMHRRLYTNQTMINDLNVYRANRGVRAIDPDHALPEPQALRYLYESIGLQPWRDSDPGGSGPTETGGKSWGVGDNYWELTAKGLTKELGYVGYYGEVIDWATQIYDATRDPGKEGDPKIKAQLEKIANARAVFRYPALDLDGNRAMRIESIVGWRDMHYPGDIVYGERPSWDATALYEAAATLNETSVGYARQMLDDNQFFASIARMLQEKTLRQTAGLLGAPDQYDAIQAQPRDVHTPSLPMTHGQPDFVFSDEEDGVVAIKHGDEILYASLYWRARNAINFLARVHDMTPTFDRVATVNQETQFTSSSMTFTRPDHVNFGFGNGGPKYPEEMHSAIAGEKLPIAKIPAGVRFSPGDESVYAGRGDFYSLRYGPYLIAMNCTTDRTFELKQPADMGDALELISKQRLLPNQPLKVGPRSTVVLYLQNK
jgi:hypothetical protein